MNLLAIDTSTNKATVALVRQDTILYKEQDSLRQHAQLILPMIADLMAELSLNFSQLDGIAFGRGPGSFTGLRIACSVAKGLAHAHDLPLYPVSSLAAIAYTARQNCPEKADDCAILAVIDARMKQLYWGLFTNNNYNADELVSDANKIVCDSEKPVILAGVGLELYLPEFSETLHQQIISQHCIYPDARAMISLVQADMIKAVNAEDALPVYIRNKVTHGESHG
jgi:tRNA threonylcarbamoyladenosine biosynthesis protein TsaB